MGGPLVALVVAMHVQSAGTCPAAADVEKLLAPLLPPGFESDARDVAALEESADGVLTLSLAQFDRGSITRRRLPRARSCREQAESVAVVLAVWEAQIHPAIVLRLDRLPAPPTPAVLATLPPEREPTPTLRRTIEPQPAGATVPSVDLVLGAGLMGAWQSGSLAPGGRIDARVDRGGTGGDHGWRARLSAVGEGEHTMSVPPGRASWWRVYLAPGVDYSLSLAPRWGLTACVSGALGMVRLAGTGFAVDHQVTSADLGAEALLRIERRGGRIRPWLGLVMATWLRRQRLDIGGAGTTALSRLEPMVTLGADFRPGQ